MGFGHMGSRGGFAGLGTLGGAEAPLYLGQVATRTFAANTALATTGGWNSRTAHYARDNITSLQLVFGNWRSVAATGDANQGGTQTITASIEYPAGVYTQVKFSGSSSIVLADGANIVSDAVAVSIPKGALFWSKRFQINTVDLLYCQVAQPQQNLALGDAVNGNGVDETLSATVDAGYQVIISPLAIIGKTRLPTIGIIGDSRAVGLSDLTVDSTGDSGYCRLFGGQFAYINMATSGDTAFNIVTNSPKRLAILDAYVSYRWIQMGGNDLLSGSTAVGVLAELATLSARWNKAKTIVSDVATVTTSSDSWATTGGQTAHASQAQRVAYNTAVGALTGYNQIVQIAPIDLAPASAFAWPVTGAAFGRTTDGIHENTSQLLIIKASNPFNPAIVR